MKDAEYGSPVSVKWYLGRLSGSALLLKGESYTLPSTQGGGAAMGVGGVWCEGVGGPRPVFFLRCRGGLLCEPCGFVGLRSDGFELGAQLFYFMVSAPMGGHWAMFVPT